MQKWISLLCGAAVVVIAVMLALPGLTKAPPPLPRGDAAVAVADAGLAEAGPSADAAADAPATSAEAPAEAVAQDDAGAALLLPGKTPKTVRCGVILVTFAGAQGAPASARSRAEAKELAEKLAVDARTDFRAAAARGDSGSAEDIGRIPRGVLEAPLEYALFTLPAGGVSDPVEAPRGFWIAKRLE